MNDSIDPDLAKELERLLDQVLERDRAEKQNRLKELEAHVRGHFYDLYEKLPDALKSAGLSEPKALQEAIPQIIASWSTTNTEKYSEPQPTYSHGEQKHPDVEQKYSQVEQKYSELEQYGLALQKALASVGYEPKDFYERLAGILGLPPDRYSSSGLGAMTCGHILSRSRSVMYVKKGGDDGI
jgi:isopenicillin N synthase-like dioxygenase